MAEAPSGVTENSAGRALAARIDGKLMARNSFWRRYGIHPGAGRRRRESALRGHVPGPEGTAALSRDVQQPAEGGPGPGRGAEGGAAKGLWGGPGRGGQAFLDYVEKTGLPNHEIEASPRQSYT